MAEEKKEEKKSKRNKIEEMNMSVEDYEKEMVDIKSRVEADSIIFKAGMNVADKNTGECMLIASMYGLINVVKFYESPQF